MHAVRRQVMDLEKPPPKELYLHSPYSRTWTFPADQDKVGFTMEYLPFSLEYTNYIHSIFVITTSTVSLFSNFLLLYVIFTTPTDHIGSYRFLLALFSANDITITLGHAALQPYIHMASAGFYVFPRYGGIMISGIPVDTLLCTLFIGTFYHMFLLLTFQFVYRYKTVTRGIGSSCTDYWSKCQWTTVGAVIYAFYMAVYLMTVEIGMKPSDATRASVPSEIYETYGVNLTDPTAGFLVVAVRNVNDTTNNADWNVESTVALALSAGLFGAISFIIAYCIHQISMAIDFTMLILPHRSSKTPIAPVTRKVHREMFRALLMQTIVPCMCSYIPLSTILLVGSVTGIPLGTYGNALFITTAIFPTLNAVFVLYFVTKFRNAVVHTFKLPSTWAEAPVKLLRALLTLVLLAIAVAELASAGPLEDRIFNGRGKRGADETPLTTLLNNSGRKRRAVDVLARTKRGPPSDDHGQVGDSRVKRDTASDDHGKFGDARKKRDAATDLYNLTRGGRRKRDAATDLYNLTRGGRRKKETVAELNARLFGK